VCSANYARFINNQYGQALSAGAVLGLQTLDQIVTVDPYELDDGCSDQQRADRASARLRGSPFLQRTFFLRQTPTCFVLNISNLHWVTLYVVPAESTVFLFDPLNGPLHRGIKSLLFGGRKGHGLLRGRWTLDEDLCGNRNKLQTDGYQCGVWALTGEQWFLGWVASAMTLGDPLPWKAFFAQKLRELSLTDQRGGFARARVVAFIARQRQFFRSSLPASHTEFHHELRADEVQAIGVAKAKRAKSGARASSNFRSTGTVSEPTTDAPVWLRDRGGRTTPLNPEASGAAATATAPQAADRHLEVGATLPGASALAASPLVLPPVKAATASTLRPASLVFSGPGPRPPGHNETGPSDFTAPVSESPSTPDTRPESGRVGAPLVAATIGLRFVDAKFYERMKRTLRSALADLPDDTPLAEAYTGSSLYTGSRYFGLLSPSSAAPPALGDRGYRLLGFANLLSSDPAGAIAGATSLLLTEDPDLDFDLDGHDPGDVLCDTALVIACRWYDAPFVGLLLDNGANPSIVNARQETPLAIAIRLEKDREGTAVSALLEAALRTSVFPGPVPDWPVSSWRHPPRADQGLAVQTADMHHAEFATPTDAHTSKADLCLRFDAAYRLYQEALGPQPATSGFAFTRPVHGRGFHFTRPARPFEPGTRYATGAVPQPCHASRPCGPWGHTRGFFLRSKDPSSVDSPAPAGASSDTAIALFDDANDAPVQRLTYGSSSPSSPDYSPSSGDDSPSFDLDDLHIWSSTTLSAWLRHEKAPQDCCDRVATEKLDGAQLRRIGPESGVLKDLLLKNFDVPLSAVVKILGALAPRAAAPARLPAAAPARLPQSRSVNMSSKF